MQVLQVTTVYGDKCFIRADDLARVKFAARLTTKDGTYLPDRVNPKTGRLVQMKRGACTMLALANIAETKEIPQ